MTVVWIVAAVGAYVLATALLVAELLGGWARGGRTGRFVLLAGAVAHAVHLAIEATTGGPRWDISDSLSIAALLLVGAYLAAAWRWRVGSLGAFVAPLALLFVLASSVGRTWPAVPHEVRWAMLPVHVGLNVLGVAAFALAFVAAVAYVLQERQLRRKRFDGPLQRLPALDELDALGVRLVGAGFVLLTGGILTGALWAARRETGAFPISGAQAFAVLAWAIFAAVLALRAAAGWRGRRAAIGTMLGFACAVLVLVGYAMRLQGGGG
ncbi:MAG: cytochrome c biogenesis protein CcsA [Myxococcota bacterium]|nr:cytochrome c biogenesis protein CcsA [Myxococcota bacterium]MDW8361780.1 cytochrome c biogenesis protein CcsA [Myxococcales bacterium]